MTYKEVAAMVKNIGFPCAYYQFPNGTEQACPFICFYFTRSNDLAADDTNYQRIRQLAVELYTGNKDFEKEKTVEDALNANGLVYSREESYLDSERLYMVTFITEVVVADEEVITTE